jgi:hypothetical protein
MKKLPSVLLYGISEFEKILHGGRRYGKSPANT